MSGMIGDLRLAMRQLLRSRTFTFTVILTLALGIGLNAAIFTMVDCVLLRPLGYHDADRIYGLNTRFVEGGRSIPRVGGGDFTDVAKGVSSLEYAAYYQSFHDNLDAAAHTLYTDVGYVSPVFGQAMGVEPLAGRLFLANGNSVKDPQEAMVSNAFAQQNFGTAAQALGQMLKFRGKLRVIVGVLPQGFSFPDKTEVWIEGPTVPENENRTAYNQRAILKVRPGVSSATLNAEMATLSQQLSTSYPEDHLKSLEGISLQEQLVGKIRPTLRLLMGSVVVVLLIVCVNITHLQFVRATRLRREITIRTALGATHAVLARRAALEVLLLAFSGCVVGVLIAMPALRLLVQLAPAEIPRLAEVTLNLEVIGFSFLISLVTMGATALLPVWRSWRIDPASAMKQDSVRGMESPNAGRLRSGLVIGEVALTLMLSVMALMLVRQLIAESQRDLGFQPDGLIMMDTHRTSASDVLSQEQTLDPKALEAARQTDLSFLESLIVSVRGIPGVRSAAAASGAPMSSGGSDVNYAIHGASEFKAGEKLPNANILAITPGYLETMSIPVLKGRGITDADRTGSELVMVISESAAHENFSGVDPIGKQIMSGWDHVAGWHTIVGVIGDVRQDSPESAPYPTLYTPLAQHLNAATDVQVMVRTRADAGAMAATLSKYVKQQFPQVAVRTTTMFENIGESQRAKRFRTLLFSCFAGVSVLLSMTGMYGVTAYTVAQRRFEFALRFALGAQRGQVMGSVLKSALAVAGIGVVSGIALSLGMTRVMGNLLGQMPAIDPIAYVVAAGAVLLIALSASLLPAQRAAMVEPMQMLRNE